MANPLTRYLNDRLVQPAVEKALATTQLPLAFGSGTSREVSLVKSIGQAPQVDPIFLYSLYKLNADISGSAHKWASHSTNRGYRLSLADPGMKMTDDLQDRAQEIERRLSRPNPNDTFTSLLYWTALQLPIIGRAFWFVSRNPDGSPLEIWPMHPAITRIVATSAGEILGYVMRMPGSEPITFTPEEVIYFKLPNPLSTVSGEGRVELLVEEAGIDVLALRSNKSIFLNGQSYSAVILLDEKTTPKDARELTDQIKQAHTGAENQHKIVAVSKARDFKPMTMTMRDMEFVGLRHLSTEKVTTVMGVPEFLLGNHNTGDYQSGKFLVREFHSDVVDMVQGILAQPIAERLVQTIDDRFELSLIPPDSSDPDDLRNDLMQGEQQGILTKDEVRQDAFGKDPLPVDDKAADESNDSQTDDTTDGGAGDPQDNAKQASTIDDYDTLAKALSPDDYASEKDYLDALAAERDAQFDDLAAAITPSIASYFATNEQLFITGMDQGIAEYGVDGYVDQQADALDTMLTAVLVAALLPSLQAGIDAASVNLGLTLSQPTKQKIIDSYATTVLPEHAAGINATTRTKLKQSLADGTAAKEDADRLRARAAQIFQEGQAYRASLIADTESAQAFDFSNYESVQASELTLEELEQVWLTERDERVCLICLKMDYQAVPIDSPFLFPDTEIELVPGEVHPKCRCTRYFRRISTP